MSVKQSFNFAPQMRLDINHARSIDSSVIYDFGMLLKCFQNNTPYILSGFSIPVSGITGPASGLQVVVDGAIAWVPGSAGSFLKIDDGAANEVLSSSNVRVVGSFAPNQQNYVGVRFKRKADVSTSDLVQFWDVDAQVEFSKTIPLGLVLEYEFVISTVNFGDTAPIAVVTTSLSNNVTQIKNAKQGMFRLGTGGSSPNPSNEFALSPSIENNLTATSPSDADPFAGGDWEINTFKDWMDAVMSQIKRLLGSAYWYSNGSTAVNGVNLTDLFNDTNLSVLTGQGRFKHTTPGLLQWTSDLSLTSLSGRRTYTIAQNTTGITLNDDQVAYISIERNEDFQPANTFTVAANSYVITGAINVAGLVAGDFVKFETHSDSAWRKVLSVVGAVITLENAPEPSYPTAATSAKLLRSKGLYSNLDVNVSDRQDVPSDANTYWLAYRKDSVNFNFTVDTIANSGATRSAGVATIKTTAPHGLVEGTTVSISGVSDATFNVIADIQTIPSATEFTFTSAGADVAAATAGDGSVVDTAKIYLRWLGEIGQGEELEIDDQISADTLLYMGASSETDNTPSYSSSIRGVAGENLTLRAGKLTDAIGDSQEDRSAFLHSDEVVTWTGTQLEFTQDIILEIINTKSGVTSQHIVDVLESPIVIANGESIWVSIDRTQASEVLTVNNSGITPIPAQSQANKDVFILFKRIDADGQKFLHLPLHKQLFTEGQTVRLGASGGGNAVVKAKYLDPVSTTLPVGVSYLVDGQTAIDGDIVLFTNLTNPADNNKIYELSGVGVALAWEVLRSFNGFVTPEDGDSVRIQAGDAFREQLAVFDGTDFLVNDIVRYFDGISGNYWEQSSIKSATIANNTTDTIFSVNVASSENWIIPYSILRGTTKETGQLFLTSDGTTASVATSNAYIGSTGVTFNATIALGVLDLEYTSDNSGAAGSMKYFVQRWSDSAGGPSGLPSYSGGGGGSTPAAGASQEVQYNTAGALDADSRFKWDSTAGALNLNGLEVGVLSSAVTLLDNQVVAVTALTYNATTYPFATFEYSITRGASNYRIGKLMIVTDGVTVSIQDASTEVGTSGIVLSAIINTGNVEVQYTSTNTGSNASLKTSVRRWA